MDYENISKQKGQKMRRLGSILLSAVLVLSLVACGEKEEKAPETTPAATEESVTVNEVSDTEGAALKDLYADYFMMGAAINGSAKETAAIHHEGMANVLKKHYNSTSLSNLMKPCYLLDEEGCKKLGSDANATDVAVTFDACKESLDFCKENGIKMRGHLSLIHI